MVTLTRRAARPNAPGLVLAVLAAAWHVFLMTTATNDNFLHLTLAKQWLAGEWPVRDFFDQSSILQYAISAATLRIGGDRLLSEAVVVGIGWGVSSYLVFAVVRRLSGHTVVATLASLLIMMAGARGYSYPKGIVYAAAAALWWRYVSAPSRIGMVLMGTWAAVAFYWRADHGVYVATAVALACVAAHGLRSLAFTRCATAAVTMALFVLPYFAYVQATVGLRPYVQAGLAAAQAEHATQGPHAWPIIRFGTGALATDPAERYAPTIAIRWAAASTSGDREHLLTRYGLTLVESDEGVDRVKLSERSIQNLRGLINDPLVADTAGVDRTTATLPPSSWTQRQRWTFTYPWLRVRFLPMLDPVGRASEMAVALFYLLPIAMLLTAGWLAALLPGAGTARNLAAFALLALIVDGAMLRIPFPARAADAVVLSAIVFGCCVAGMWRAAAGSRGIGRAFLASGAVALGVAVSLSVAVSGRFGERIANLAGGGTSLTRAQSTWSGVYRELVSSPPLAFFIDRPARLSLRLAGYVRDCVPAAERLLVLWFEPEIYYYSDRLMAQRHLVFPSTWASLADEQRLTRERIARFDPPIALARRSALDGYARVSYPDVVDYVEREYRPQASLTEDGEDYIIYARRNRPVLRTVGPDEWPCYIARPSEWARVGRFNEGTEGQ